MMVRVLFIGAIDVFSDEENRLRPLWPAYLSSYIRKHLSWEGFEFKFTNSRIEYHLRTFKPNIVAISSVSKNFGYAAKYAGMAKKCGLPVIVGGMHITMLPQCLTEDMDIGCIGEGEQTFCELMRLFVETGRFDAGHLAKINGIIYRDDGRLIRTPKRVPLKSLDELPHPDRSVTGYGRRAYVYTTRGCRYKCVFCACTSHWGTVRYASPDYVLEEVRELVDHGVRIIRFNDDNFAANKQRLLKISSLIVKHGLHRKARFTCWCRSNNVTPDVVRALRNMNVVSVKMGLESGCDRTLDYLKGNVTVRDNWNAVNLLKDAGIQVNADFIIGAPEESVDEMMQTYDFIKNSRVGFVDVNVLAPLPGTPIWEYAEKKKLVSDNMDWRKIEFKFSKNGHEVPILCETVSRRQLQKIYRQFLRLRFYKTLKAIPHSPWLNEFPILGMKRLLGKLARAGATLAPGFFDL